MSTTKNFGFNKKKIEVNQTAFRKHEQINIIYLLSEFIDNFKQNFDDNLEKINNPEITFEFNNQEGYLKISDNGSGFSIIPALNIGYDESRDGNLNEYGVGMKIALDYLTDFSAIVSEHLDNFSQPQKEFAHFIWKQNIYKEAIKLKPNNVCGTSIYLFAELKNFNKFTSSLEILNENQIVDFPIDPADLDYFSEFLGSKSYINTLLNHISYCLPIITAGLFDRYSPLVNSYKNKGVNFKIKFKVINENGEQVTVEPFSKYEDKPSNFEKHEKPIYFQEISANNFNFDNTFSFLALKHFFTKNKLIAFLECLKDENTFLQIKLELEEFFIHEVNKYFDKIEKTTDFKFNLDFETLINFAKNTYQSSISNRLNDFDFQKNYLFSNPIWSTDQRFVLPRVSLEPLFAGLLSLRETDETKIVSPYFLNLDFKQIELFPDSGKIRPLRTINNKFTLSYHFFISSSLNKISFMDHNPYKFMSNESGFYTGFRLIKLDRAIFHGPNYLPLQKALSKKFTGNIPIQKVLTNGGLFPSRFFNLELFNRAYKSPFFPHNDNDNDIAKIIKGGDAAGYTRNIYGTIYLPKKEIFKTSTNKVNLENLPSLEEFTKNVLILTAMMIPSKIIFALSQFLKSSNKISEDNFISRIIKKYQNFPVQTQKEESKPQLQVQKQPVLTKANSDGNLNLTKNKDILFNSLFQNEKEQNILKKIELKNMNINNFFENIINLNNFFTKEEINSNEIIFNCFFHKNVPVLRVNKLQDKFSIDLLDKKKWNVVVKNSMILENKICKALVIHILSQHTNELITNLDSRIL